MANLAVAVVADDVVVTGGDTRWLLILEQVIPPGKRRCVMNANDFVPRSIMSNNNAASAVLAKWQRFVMVILGFVDGLV